MAFDIIRTEIRTERMIEWFSGVCEKITDFIVGSKIRSKFETVAVEMEAQDYAFYTALEKAIPTALYQAFDFSLRPASKAFGYVTFGISELNTPAPTQLLIPAGTVVATMSTPTTQSRYYVTTSPVYIKEGERTVEAPVLCTTAGADGNTPPSTVTVMQSMVMGIDYIRNADGLYNGADQEDETGRKIRFQEYVTTLTRGISAAVVYGAKQAIIYGTDGYIEQQVLAALVTEPPAIGPAGIVDCYIWNGYGTASTELIALAQQYINGYTDDSGNLVPGYKAAGVVISVKSVVVVPVHVTITVDALYGWQNVRLKEQIESGVALYIHQIGIGNEVQRNQIVSIIKPLEYVVDLAVTMKTSTGAVQANGDVAIATNSIAVVKSITVTINTTT